MISSSPLTGTGRAGGTAAVTAEELAARLGSSSLPRQPDPAPKTLRSTLRLLGAQTNGLSFDFLGEKEETNTGKAARFQLR